MSAHNLVTLLLGMRPQGLSNGKGEIKVGCCYFHAEVHGFQEWILARLPLDLTIGWPDVQYGVWCGWGLNCVP